ncbi:phage tail length tape measure family protein [Ensifer canadensis]
MTSPLKLSIGVNIDASGAKAGGTAAQAAVASIGTEASKTAKSLQQLIDRTVGLNAGAASAGYRDRAADIAAYGVELDRLRAKMDPLFAAQQRYQAKLLEIAQAERVGAISASAAIDIRMRETAAYNAQINALDRVATARKASAEAFVGRNTITPDRGADVAAYGAELDRLRAKYNPLYAAVSQYKAAVADIRTAHSAGAISAKEMTAEIERQRRATLESIDAIKGRNTYLHENGATAGFRRQNLGYQAFDIGQGLSSGLPLGMIAAQQLPQVAQIYAGPGGGMKTFLKDVASLATGAVTAVGAVPLALAAAGTAAILYDRNVSSASAKAEQALAKHEEALKRIKGLFDETGSASERYGQRVQSAISFTGRSDRTALEEALAAQTKAVGTGLLNAVPRGSGAAFNNLYGPYLQAVQHFIAEAQQGRGDVEAFNDEVIRIGNANQADAKIQKIGRDLLETTKAATETAAAIKNLNNELARTTLDTARTDAATAAARFRIENADSLARISRSNAAALAGLGARSPGELAEAARRRVRAEPVDPRESPEVRTARENATATLARAQAEQQLADAQRARHRALEQTMASQQLDLELIGKTGGEAAALRKEFELTAQLREEAARNGIAMDERELALIREKSAEYGRMADAIAKANLANELRFEREQLSRSNMDQQIASRLRSAGQPIDFNSAEARAIRETMREQEARGLIGGFFTDLRGGFREEGKSIGEVFGDAFKNSLLKVSERLTAPFEKMLENLLIGSAKDEPGGLLAGFLGMGGGKGNSPANDNSAITGLIGSNVVRLPLAAPNSSLYRQAISNLESRGSGGYSALGPLTNGDRAYGAYQVMGANIPSWTKGALGKSLTPQQYLADPRAQDSVFDHYFGKSVAKYGNPQDAASVWFTGRPLSKGAGATDILGTSGSAYVDKFNTELDRLSGSAGKVTGSIGGLGDATSQAAKGLGTLGNGFDKFGQTLSTSFFPSAPGAGGGALGGLFSMFPGIGGFLGSKQLTGAIGKGSWGLWSEGGFTGHGGKYDPAGFVHKGEVVFSQEDVARNGGVAAVEAIRLRGYAEGGAVAVDPIMSAPRLAQAANQNIGASGGRDIRFHFTQALDVDDSGALILRMRHIAQTESASAAQTAIDGFAYELPDRIQQIEQNPRRRG